VQDATRGEQVLGRTLIETLHAIWTKEQRWGPGSGAPDRGDPDVAVVDLQMPAVDGVAVVTELSRQLPACASVILTGHGRPHVLRQALASGARGFLAKGAPSTALADVVRRVHEGQRYVDPILAADALTAPPHH
jgi:two-component system response regulator DesR